MTDRKDKTAPLAVRDRGEALRSQNGQTASGSKIAEMATLTAAASGLALGAIDMARADSDMFENNVFARILRDDPDEPMPLAEDRHHGSEEQAQVSNPTLEQVPTASAPATDQIALNEVALAEATKLDTVKASSSPADTAGAQNAHVAEPQTLEAGMQMPSSTLIAEKLTEGIATQISSGIDRVFDEVASGTLQPGFAQDLAGEIISNVRSMLDEVLPTAADLGSTIRADVAETLGGVGDGAGALLSSSTDMIDQLTGRVDDMLADVGLLSTNGSAFNGLGSAATELASLPTSILGGSEGKPGALGELFYDDGQGSLQMAATTMLDAVPSGLGFLGQSDLSDASGALGFGSNSNALHLV